MKQLIFIILAIFFLFGCTQTTDSNTPIYPDVNAIVDSNNFLVDSNTPIDTNTIVLDINYLNTKDLNVSQSGTDYQNENYDYVPSEPN